MPSNTFTLIEKITVGAAGASSITFTSIPQTYTDLKIVVSGRSTVNGETAMNIYFNGSTTAVYDRISLSGNGSAASSASATNQGEIFAGRVPANDYTSSTFGNTEIYIPNYTGSNNKSVSFDSVSEQNATTAFQVLIAGLWKNSAAITSATLSIAGANFVQYTTAYLYGIAKEGVSPSPSSAPYATGGDSIVFDGTYWIHTFTSSGTFTPKKALTCDYLVVAGGGGGNVGNAGANQWTGGGGGAGGLRSTVTATGGGGSLESALSLVANTGYTVTVGAGGSAGGSSGSNSVFSSITSTGGGGGGNNNGNTGGSGGGAGASAGGNTGGAGTANQGYAGGNSADRAGGGGGGAGAVGANGNGGTNFGGNGGNGVATSISGTSTTYAGGGGGGGGDPVNSGGAGGSGGGGAGGRNGSAAASATANTGGGGGGTWVGSSSGNGGSGIVIVRYAA